MFDQAPVMGINVMLSPENSVLLANMIFLSPDGRSFSFDERANGYARGEGVVALVIKPLAIPSTMVMTYERLCDPRRQITTDAHPSPQPSAEAQEALKALKALIRDAYRKAGLGFEQTRYVEAHGSCSCVSCPLTVTNGALTWLLSFYRDRNCTSLAKAVEPPTRPF